MNECKIFKPDGDNTNMALAKERKIKTIRYVDLFCGIGGFRLALQSAAKQLSANIQCVFSSDIDKDCKKAYQANFGEMPYGDITKIKAESVPSHEVLLAGFPCQPFSIIGNLKGFSDTRGTLFFEIARIIEAKKPDAFVLENVKLLAGHNRGKTLSRILEALKDLGYHVDFKILNAINFGLPQKRERIFIVGFRKPCSFVWPEGGFPMEPLKRILENNVPISYYASDHIKKNRRKKHAPTIEPTIWHENKAGHISAYPYSCALRAGASYNYLLVNGERRLTEREMLRLQGFPDSFKIVCNYSQTRKQAGNSLPIPIAKQIINNLFFALGWTAVAIDNPNLYSFDNQFVLIDKKGKYEKAKITNNRKIQPSLSAE